MPTRWNVFVCAIIVMVVVGHLLLYGGLGSTVEGQTLRNHTSYNLRAVCVPLLIGAGALVGRLRTRVSAWRAFCCTYVALTAAWVSAEQYAWQSLRFTSDHEAFLSVAHWAPYAPWVTTMASLVVAVAVHAGVRAAA